MSIAMGSGTDIAIESPVAIVLANDLLKVGSAFDMSQRPSAGFLLSNLLRHSVTTISLGCAAGVFGRTGD